MISCGKCDKQKEMFCQHYKTPLCNPAATWDFCPGYAEKTAGNPPDETPAIQTRAQTGTVKRRHSGAAK